MIRFIIWIIFDFYKGSTEEEGTESEKGNDTVTEEKISEKESKKETEESSAKDSKEIVKKISAEDKPEDELEKKPEESETKDQEKSWKYCSQVTDKGNQFRINKIAWKD